MKNIFYLFWQKMHACCSLNIQLPATLKVLKLLINYSKELSEIQNSLWNNNLNDTSYCANNMETVGKQDSINCMIYSWIILPSIL